ncbi:hypothetical protein GCM10022199_08040 [Marihabitans asiaticum]|uniref:Uncharacterized protein n=1 Tax=Marihabitans asiaticum TaxID=415218 RepID=A0A560WH72_9MICO|nr:hypothetical protein [Marihabitans asiaticum]TWD16835.1 hypothetical protein FB557_0378 [Marihabitans asiaticum]
MSESETSAGVHFPREGDGRPTTATARGILADSVATTDPELAARIHETQDWRTDYVGHVRAVTEASSRSADDAQTIAREGLAAMRRRLVLVDDDGGETSLAEASLEEASGSPFATESVVGTADPVTELRVPFEGAELSGDALLGEVGRWVEDGLVEPSFATAVGEVVTHPEWLALPDRQVLLIGAGSEMGPLEPLLDWGVDVHAIDLPRSRAWRHKKGIAAGGAGTLTFPVDGRGDSGADVVHQPAQVLQWIRSRRTDEPLVVGMHAYADSGVHVRVSAATDLLMRALTADDRHTALAWLATPTDSFVVPPEVVTEAHRRWADRGRVVRGAQAPLRMAGRGKAFAPAYPGVADGSAGIADVLVPQQGPNYAIAKRVQRWQGVEGEGVGQRVSFNVAPATWTRSVVKNPVLGAAYAGAHHFGVEVFQPETVRPLMAALLVRDLMVGMPAREHPEQLFSDAAAHGGLWRVGYEPRTALGFAAAAGLPSRLRASIPRGLR